MCKIKVELTGEKALLYTPYNAGFVSAVKRIGGARWTGDAWQIPADALENARKMMLKHFGETDEMQGETITVRATVVSDQNLEELCRPVTSLGKTLARATGRDSGARVGDDVVLVSGDIDSNGSVKNWKTWIKRGTVFELHNVSKSLYENGYDMYNSDIMAYELVDDAADRRKSLIEERERLVARLAEIDKALAA